jgi:hypothetical protein
MNKKLITELAIIFIGSLVLGGLMYFKKTKEVSPLLTQSVCGTDVMMCPDGSSISRTGPNCEFTSCKQELPSYLIAPTASTTEASPVPPVVAAKLPTKTVTTNLFKKISSGAVNTFQQITNTAKKDIATGIKDTTNVVATPQVQPTTTTEQPAASPAPKVGINETRYSIENNKIVDEQKNVIYTLPSTSANSSGTGYTNTHDVNVVPVNDVAPVIGAIPVDGLPGKYYLSENSFNVNSACKFANKIYILDTKAGTRTLMYEENSDILLQEDPRSCTSEMFLLATEGGKLILKYHTVGTNMVCESTWSEPEKTWYIDVTHPERGTKRYLISYALYQEAETKETTCRATVEGTSTPLIESTSTQNNG